ncbi:MULTISPECIES: hypothetical protein [Bradyrhizobium]|uniref:hypothetical protein n=1 Tax=Bradyrhizobium TaxID=374 RepID=UPI001EDB1AF4|nr:hypothetical protein [Bradyrhizobium zhengyangense]MCG2639666.1 hypothetical protein [Bradyrhizobium zhengyangense]
MDISGFNSIAGAVSDLFAADADRAKGSALRLKAQGDRIEGENYGLAADLASQNAKFTEVSTAIKQTQLEREQTMAIGSTHAAIGGAGLAESGSALDVLADSTRQASLAKSVLGQQGLITEAGYQEQQQSYLNMKKAAGIAAQADEESANAADRAAEGATITGIAKGIIGVASLFTGGAAAPAGQAAGSAVGFDGGIGSLY